MKILCFVTLAPDSGSRELRQNRLFLGCTVAKMQILRVFDHIFIRYQFGVTLASILTYESRDFGVPNQFIWRTLTFTALKSRSDGRITLTNLRMRESTFRGDSRDENFGGVL